MRFRLINFSLTLLVLSLLQLRAYSQSHPPSSHLSISLSGSPSTPSKTFGEEFELLYSDRYFYIDNHGLTRVIVYLNGYQFKLTVDPLEVRQGANTYVIPLRGIVNIDIFPLLNPQRNIMSIDGRGPSGAEATIIVADHIIGDTIHYVLNVVKLPKNVQLSQNYPNPFNLSTNFVYEVPQNLIDGVNVQLVIYNLLGQKVRTLVDQRNFPGRFTVQWNGIDDSGLIVAGGVYFYRLQVGESRQTRRLVLLK